MKKILPLSLSLLFLLSVANRASAQFTYDEDFNSTSVLNSYAASTGGVSTSDGSFIRRSSSANAADAFGVGLDDNVSDESPFSTGNELRNGWKYDGTAVAFFTLPKSVGVWDSNLDYTISINVRSYDTADTNGSVTGRFIIASRKDDDSLIFLGKNVALDRSAADGWTTVTQTVSGAEVDAADVGFGVNNQRIYVSFSKTSNNSGDLMLLDNFSITAISAIPEPSSSALLLGSGFGVLAFLRRRR